MHVLDGKLLAACLVLVGTVAIAAFYAGLAVLGDVLGLVAFDADPAAVVALFHFAIFALLFAERSENEKMINLSSLSKSKRSIETKKNYLGILLVPSPHLRLDF